MVVLLKLWGIFMIGGGGYLAYALIVDNPPYGKIDKGQSADHDTGPCQVFAPGHTDAGQYKRRQEEGSSHDCHKPSG